MSLTRCMIRVNFEVRDETSSGIGIKAASGEGLVLKGNWSSGMILA